MCPRKTILVVELDQAQELGVRVGVKRARLRRLPGRAGLIFVADRGEAAKLSKP